MSRTVRHRFAHSGDHRILAGTPTPTAATPWRAIHGWSKESNSSWTTAWTWVWLRMTRRLVNIPGQVRSEVRR